MGERIGLDPEQLAILENYKVEDWQRFSTKWHPFTIELVRILSSYESQQRADIANSFSEIEGSGEYMEMITHIAALSDNAYEKIKMILFKTPQ